MQYDTISQLEWASSAEDYEKRLMGVIQLYGVDHAAQVMERYVQKRLMASGHTVPQQEILDYVKRLAGRLYNDTPK